MVMITAWSARHSSRKISGNPFHPSNPCSISDSLYFKAFNPEEESYEYVSFAFRF